MAGKTVVVLGGGVGGVVAANRLRRLLGREHRVVLVDRTVVHSFAPSFTWVMLGQRDPARISRDLRSLSRKGIEFVPQEVSRIDLGNRRVVLEDRELTYDYLIVALGAHYSIEGIPGLGCASTFYSLEGADGLREELPKFRSGRIAVVVSGMPYKCPAAPYEGALLLDHYFRRRGLRGEIEIRVFTPEPAPLPVAGPAVGEQVVDLLVSREVAFSPGSQLVAVDPDGKRLVFKDGSDAPFDLLIVTPLHRVPAVAQEAGLCADGAWVSVDRETLATAFEGVYAVGDVTGIPLANGLMLPKAGVFAHGEAEVVARNIAAEIAGGQGRWAFGGQGACFLETGYGKAAYATGHFFAEPEPQVALRSPGRRWHWAKLGFERLWLFRWF